MIPGLTLHSLSPIAGHAATAIASIVVFVCGSWIVGRARARRDAGGFWRRQSRAALERAKFFQMPEIPPPLKVIEEKLALDQTLTAISTARELGLLDLLEEQPGASLDQIARFLGFSERQTRAAMDILSLAEVVGRQGDGYVVTPGARLYLFEDSPFLLSGALPRPMLPRRFLRLLRAGLIPGSVARWAKGKAHRPLHWAAAMHRISFPLGFALHETGLLERAKTVLDAAGGAGSVCIALAMKSPQKDYTVIELPGSVAAAEKMISAYGVSHRVKCLGMDMFRDAWPKGFDAIVFTNIFHDWEDARCSLLARQAIESLSPGGVLILQEALLHEGDGGPLWTANLSLEMAIFTHGRQFRASELTALLEQTGFIDVRVRPLLGYYSAVVGVRPS